MCDLHRVTLSMTFNAVDIHSRVNQKEHPLLPVVFNTIELAGCLLGCWTDIDKIPQRKEKNDPS